MATLTEDLKQVLANRDPNRVSIVAEAEPGRGEEVRQVFSGLGVSFDSVDVQRKTVLTATVTRDQLNALRQNDAIAVLDHDPTFRPLGAAAPGFGGEAVPAEDLTRVSLGEVMQRMNVPDAWDRLGHRGEGVTVGVIDTPIQADHPSLRDSVAGTRKNGGQGLHGTWVASAMVGSPFETSGGVIHGAAPDAELYAHGALSGGGANVGEIAEGIDYLLKQNVDVINISFGGPHSRVLQSLIESAVEQGTAVVSSAGNSGPGLGSATCPAHHDAATCVGSVSTDGSVAAFSSRGPGWRGEQKPELSAFGGHSTLSGGEQIITEAVLGAAPTNAAEYLVGTSMASPQAAGIAALGAAAEDT